MGGKKERKEKTKGKEKTFRTKIDEDEKNEENGDQRGWKEKKNKNGERKCKEEGGEGGRGIGGKRYGTSDTRCRIQVEYVQWLASFESEPRVVSSILAGCTILLFLCHN